MKIKKLFAVALTVSLYVLFIFGFTSFDQQGKVQQALTDVDLTNPLEIAIPVDHVEAPGSELQLKTSFRRPMPRPDIKPPPKPKRKKPR